VQLWYSVLFHSLSLSYTVFVCVCVLCSFLRGNETATGKLHA
jgi:hypothetical protein